MLDYNEVKAFWDYLEYYAEEDEEDYDGIHSGGVRGIRADAPETAKQAYKEYLKQQKGGNKL